MISEQKSNFQTVMTLLNHHLLSRAPVSQESQRQEKVKEMFVPHGPWRWYVAYLGGHVGKPRQGAGRESAAGPGVHVFIRACGQAECFVGLGRV